MFQFSKMPISYLFFLLFFSHIIALSSSLDCNAADRRALLTVKAELGNPPKLSRWQPNVTNCCRWPNVACTYGTNRIGLIYLHTLDVSAKLPQSLGDLTELQSIHLETIPGIYGTIPHSFSRLTKLKYLTITNTSVSGRIPHFLSRTNLTSLILSDNKLSGLIPLSLTKLPNLRYIDFRGNSLSGRIPSGLLHGIDVFLYLARNKLTGRIPKDYGNRDIRVIDLSHNRLIGDASFLFGSTTPTSFMIDLSWNRLEFDLTRAVFSQKLYSLDLSHNRIKGNVPKSLQDVLLRFLNLSYNQLCGEIPNQRFMVNHTAASYIHNKCLCGVPLPPCKPFSL